MHTVYRVSTSCLQYNTRKESSQGVCEADTFYPFTACSRVASIPSYTKEVDRTVFVYQPLDYYLFILQILQSLPIGRAAVTQLILLNQFRFSALVTIVPSQHCIARIYGVYSVQIPYILQYSQYDHHLLLLKRHFNLNVQFAYKCTHLLKLRLDSFAHIIDHHLKT